jgi:hypothetical protein
MCGSNLSKKVANYLEKRDNSRNHSQRSIGGTGQVYELYEQDYTTEGFKTIQVSSLRLRVAHNLAVARLSQDKGTGLGCKQATDRRNHG